MASIVARGKSFAVVYEYTDETGKKKQKWESGFTREAAEVRKSEVEYQQKSQQFIIPNDITVEEFMWKWLPVYAQKKWTFNTYTTNVSLVQNHILPHIGPKKVQEVKRPDIDAMFNKLSKTLKGSYKHGVRVRPEPSVDEIFAPLDYLSSTTLKEVFDILRPFFRTAVEYKIIKESPLPKEGPKKQDDELNIWDDKMMVEALTILEEEPLLHLAIHCAYVGTMRNGETLAITLDGLDFERKRIFIGKTLQRVAKEALKQIQSSQLLKVFPTCQKSSKSCLILKKPKTPQSVRWVFMTQPLEQEIQARLKQIQLDKARFREKYHDYGLLFCLENGDPIEPKLLLKWFMKWQKHAECPFPQLNIQGVRHSAATYKMELSDGDYKSVQGDTGHAKADVLLNTYTHLRDERRRQLSRKFEHDFYRQAAPVSANNEKLFLLLLNKAQSDEELRETLQQMMQQDRNLQQIALSALLAQKTSD